MERPIAILDSGVGGLRVMAELARRLPAEDVIYLADTARGPYGRSPVAEVRRWTEECAYYMLRFDPKVLVVTCHTMGAAAGEFLRKRLRVPVFLSPGLLCQSGLAERTAGAVAILASETSLASGCYQRALGQAGVEVVCCPASELLEALEQGAGQLQGALRPLLERALEPALRVRPAVGVVLLGEVSLGSVGGLVQEAMGSGVRVLEVTARLVEEVERMLAMMNLLRTPGGVGRSYVFVSGDAERFRQCGEPMYGRPLGRVDVASPERFFRQMTSLSKE